MLLKKLICQCCNIFFNEIVIEIQAKRANLFLENYDTNYTHD